MNKECFSFFPGKTSFFLTQSPLEYGKENMSTEINVCVQLFSHHIKKTETFSLLLEMQSWISLCFYDIVFLC